MTSPKLIIRPFPPISAHPPASGSVTLSPVHLPLRTGPKLGLSPPILTLPGSATGAGFRRIVIFDWSCMVHLQDFPATPNDSAAGHDRGGISRQSEQERRRRSRACSKCLRQQAVTLCEPSGVMTLRHGQRTRPRSARRAHAVDP
jgi:hypothetical protein